MEKISVTTGVYWVEIPEADLNVLCGCPADVVKHLRKKGLIVTVEKDGYECETGPNAILLSDVSIQNGFFSNLAEFPMLQMFYKQGMLIPDHPNNTGIRPLLIGAEDQLQSQTQYIHRGNYGLVSLDEMKQAGIDETRAEAIMRMKLEFAFGAIRSTDALIDMRALGEDAVHLRNGVTARRCGVNLFELAYKDESVTVDLNLQSNEEYEPAFQLGFHSVEREYFSVIHTGEGDGWDANRPCMGSIVTFQGRIYLIDAGPNIQHSLTALGINVSDIEGVFHTHAHDDHFAGLTTLIRSDHLIKYFTPKLVRTSVEKKMSALMPSKRRNLTDYFEIHDLEFDKWNNIDGLEVMPIFSPHPVETSMFAFRVFWESDYRTYAHFSDTVSLNVLRSMIHDDSPTRGVSKEFYDTVKARYLTSYDLKKIDVGGGQIHGKAEDFIEDRSKRIVFSHIARPLTSLEREIGSNADFGVQNALIESQQDYTYQSAYRYLIDYFPEVPLFELYMLLNCRTVKFSVGSILIKKGAISNYVYLVISGVVEYIESEKGIMNKISTGSLLGELSSITGEATVGTYRAASHIEAIAIPRNLYMEFVERNDLLDGIVRVSNKRQFLRSTSLFGEMTSHPVLNRIAQSMDEERFGQDQVLPRRATASLYLLEEGELAVYLDNDQVEVLSAGGFFGEEQILFNEKADLTARSLEESRGFWIPGNLLKDIPIVQWKLLET